MPFGIGSRGVRARWRRRRGNGSSRLHPAVEALERIRLLTVPAGALSFVVDSTADYPGHFDSNGNPTNDQDPTVVTLHEAFDCVGAQEQALGASAPPATISFSLPAGSHILPSVAFGLTGPVTIDASQGSTPGHPAVYIDGNQSGGSTGPALTLNGNGCIVKGLGFINWDTGISLGGSNDTVSGCTFGIDPSGNPTVLRIGIEIDRGSSDVIGGTNSADRNVIGNCHGFQFGGAGVFVTVHSSSTVIEGNFIGTNAAGTAAIGNDTGIEVDSRNNTIGGTTTGARNIISGNVQDGIDLAGADPADPCTGNLIAGNFIGTDVTGKAKLANTRDGIGIFSYASNNTIGGTSSALGNTIAFNGNDGVNIHPVDNGNGPPPPDTGVTIRGNAIFSNGALGIDLGGTGVQLPNNTPPPGQNNNQNYPIIQNPNAAGTINGMLTSPPGTYTVEVFANGPASAPAQVLVAPPVQVTVAQGKTSASFSLTASGQIPTGATFVATATDGNGNTSELSPAAAPPGLVVNETNDEQLNADGSVATPGKRSLREAIQMVNKQTQSTNQTISFNIPGTGLPELTFDPNLGGLPAVTASGVTINGTTQSGGLVGLNGNNLQADALHLSGGDITVEGLVIFNFNGNGIKIDSNGGDTIEGDQIGAILNGASGPTVAGNTGDGILIAGVADNTIGGSTQATANLVIGSQGVGIEINGAGATGNVVTDNQIGLTIIVNPAPNGVGIELDGGASNNTIGGTTAIARNYISGSIAAGLELAGASSNIVEGNFIGTDVKGGTAIPNAFGVLIGAGSQSNVIGGDIPAEGNLISGNTGDGVDIRGSGVTGNRVQGNYIGTEFAGATALPNGVGVVLEQGASDNRVGGSS
jgi:titin